MAHGVGIWEHAQGYVGNANAEYQMAGILQLELLKRNGLRPDHHVLEIGCGALVAGRPIMQFLEPDRYVGIEPNTWLIEACRDHFPDSEELFLTKRPTFLARTDFDASETQRRFDFVISHSILSHAAHFQLDQFIGAAAKVLAPHGVILASIRFHDENGKRVGDAMLQEWQYPGANYFAVETVAQTAAKYRLTAEERADYRAFFVKYLPTNYHDWVRLRHMIAGVPARRPMHKVYGEPNKTGLETESGWPPGSN